MSIEQSSESTRAEILIEGFSLGRNVPLTERPDGAWQVSVNTLQRIIDTMPGDDKNLVFHTPNGHRATKKPDYAVFGNNRIKVLDDGGSVLIDDVPGLFRPKEFSLLSILGHNVNKVIRSHALMEQIWDGRRIPEQPNSLNVLVARTRRILGPELGGAIETIRHVGYKALSEF